MKTVFVLLTITVTYVCGDIVSYKEMKEEVDHLLKSLPAEHIDTFVPKLDTKLINDCKPAYFCKVGKVLSEHSVSKIISQHSKNQKESSLIRRLHVYNQNHTKNCSEASTESEITLHIFLQELSRCLQKLISSARP
ncbi:interleukin-13 [Hoplias malabaricus]|uniref:interleukin-13 n=1 Tax=Hoplias malabaricus TaxID=27720 RepID=UPI0034636245